MTFRNVFLLISHYHLLPILFYLMFSVVFVGIDEGNKLTIIMNMTAFAIIMNRYIELPGNVVRYAVEDIKRAYIAGGISLWRVFICSAINNMVHCFITTLIILFTAKPLFGAAMLKSKGYDQKALYISLAFLLVIGVLLTFRYRVLIDRE